MLYRHISIISLLLLFPLLFVLGQTEPPDNNSDEPKIKSKMIRFGEVDKPIKSIKIPNRKHDPVFFCDELMEYKNGFIINSITSYLTRGNVDVKTWFYYYNNFDKSISKISISNSDTIEAIVCADDQVYFSYLKNGKRRIGYNQNNQYNDILDKASTEIRGFLENSKWLKLGVENDILYALSEDRLLEFHDNRWAQRSAYSLDSFYLNLPNLRVDRQSLPTRNIVIKNNFVYFLQEVLQLRSCILLRLDLVNGQLEEYFSMLDYVDNYYKQVNEFIFLRDSSLLVFSSRLMGSQLIVNTKSENTSVWSFENAFSTFNGTKAELSATTGVDLGDTLLLASGKAIYFQYKDTIERVINFENYHQKIKEKEGLFDFSFEPRCIKKLSGNNFLIGGMWGGLYQFDISKKKLICLDDFDEDKIKKVELSDL